MIEEETLKNILKLKNEFKKILEKGYIKEYIIIALPLEELLKMN